MKIDKNLLLVKAYYFFYNAGTAPIGPYLQLMAKSIGYSTTGIGALFTAIPLLTLLTKPIVSSLADKCSLHKTLFLVFMATNGLCFFAIQWFSVMPVDRTVQFKWESPRSIFITRDDKLSDPCYRDKVISTIYDTLITFKMDCDIPYARRNNEDAVRVVRKTPMIAELNYSSTLQYDTLVMEVTSLRTIDGNEVNASYLIPDDISNCIVLDSSDLTLFTLISKPTISESDAPMYAQYWIFAVLVVVARMATNHATTIGDSICFGLLGGKPEKFGTQRLFGAAGWGLIAMLSGVITDWYSQGKYTVDYTLCFYISIIMFTLDFIAGSNLKYENKEQKSVQLFADVKKAVIGDPQFILFLLMTVFSGMYSGLLWNFLLWYVEDIANEDGCTDTSWIKTLDGIIIFVHTFIGEIPFFIISGWIIQRFGHANCMLLNTSTFALRFILYYFITDPWWILPIEVLNGINYALYVATSTSYANKVAPPGTQVTVQSIVSCAFEGVGLSSGTFFGGMLIDKWGGRMCFLMTGISAAVVSIFYAIAHNMCLPESPANGCNDVPTKEVKLAPVSLKSNRVNSL